MRKKLLQITSCTDCKYEGWSDNCAHPKIPYGTIIKCQPEIPKECPLEDVPDEKGAIKVDIRTPTVDPLTGEDLT